LISQTPADSADCETLALPGELGFDDALEIVEGEIPGSAEFAYAEDLLVCQDARPAHLLLSVPMNRADSAALDDAVGLGAPHMKLSHDLGDTVTLKIVVIGVHPLHTAQASVPGAGGLGWGSCRLRGTIEDLRDIERLVLVSEVLLRRNPNGGDAANGQGFVRSHRDHSRRIPCRRTSRRTSRTPGRTTRAALRSPST